MSKFSASYWLKTSIVLSALFLVPITTNAAVFKIGETVSQLRSDQVEDAYIAGSSVHLEKSFAEDLVIVAADALVKSSVGEDLNILSMKIRVQGDIGDDARLAGGDVNLSGDVYDDVFIAAGQVEVEQTSTIGGDLRISGGDIYVDGNVDGMLYVRGGRVVINGVVHGPVDIQAGEIAIYGRIEGNSLLVTDKITLGDNAKFDGDIDYWLPDGEISFAAHHNGDNVRFNTKYDTAFEEELSKDKSIREQLFPATIKLFMVIFFMCIVNLVSKKLLRVASTHAEKRFWKSVFFGLLYFLLVPLLTVILMITIVGIPFSLLFMVGYGFSVYFARALSAMVATCYLERKYKKKWGTPMYIGISISLYVLLKVISFIPIIGWFVTIVAVCAAYGSLTTAKLELFKKMR